MAPRREEARRCFGDGSEHGRQIDAVAARASPSSCAVRLPRPVDACALSPVDRTTRRRERRDRRGSTFRVELDETALPQARDREVARDLDELGRGTATFDGMAITHAVLDHRVKVTKCRALFATHYHVPPRTSGRTPPSRCTTWRASSTTARDVTFLYKFTTGACNRCTASTSRASPASPPSSSPPPSRSRRRWRGRRREVQGAARPPLLALPEKVSPDEARAVARGEGDALRAGGVESTEREAGRGGAVLLSNIRTAVQRSGNSTTRPVLRFISEARHELTAPTAPPCLGAELDRRAPRSPRPAPAAARRRPRRQTPAAAATPPPTRPARASRAATAPAAPRARARARRAPAASTR